MQIYTRILSKLNKRMRKQNKHILLYVDNCASHVDMELSNITVKYFPPNTTSHLQVMNLIYIYLL